MVKRALIFIHRWLGIALCVLFLLWFPSGIGMMYFPMPSVTPTSRFERLPILQPSKVTISPAEAAQKLSVDPEDLTLTSFDGRPAYRAGGGGGGPGAAVRLTGRALSIPARSRDTGWDGGPDRHFRLRSRRPQRRP